MATGRIDCTGPECPVCNEREKAILAGIEVVEKRGEHKLAEDLRRLFGVPKPAPEEKR